MPTFNFDDREVFQLQDHEIDIWLIPLHTELFDTLSLLNSQETERANRYYFERHRRRFRIARAMMKYLLAQYLNAAPLSLEFDHNRHGKPFLHNPIKLNFNLSHSGDYALLAVGLNHELGIDIEQYSARPYLGLADEVFSLGEINALNHALPAQKPWLFFHIWSQKEAFIKACGLGLSYPLKEFTSSFNCETISLLDMLQNQTWHLTPFMLKACHASALCHHPSITQINLRSLYTQVS